MKRFIILLALALIAFAGCTPQESQEVETDDFGLTVGQEEEAKEAQALKMKEVACEDSGGTFDGETCTCPDDTYGDDFPLYTYDEETGYCMDAFGIPGGALGEQEKADHPLSE